MTLLSSRALQGGSGVWQKYQMHLDSYARNRDLIRAFEIECM